MKNMEKEKNFWDLCVACADALGRGCKAVGHWLAEMIRLSFRVWWIVLPVLLLTVAAGFYYSRLDNLKYKVRAVAILNGPTITQFDQRYAVLQAGQTIPSDAPIAQPICGRTITDLRSFRVIDVYHDSIADYVDLKRKSKPTDTINVQMQDRLCLQFTIKRRDMDQLPQIEESMLRYLNEDESMQLAYKTYMPNLERQIKFNHDQLEKLDSLTTEYYFHSNPGESPTNIIREGLVMMGDWKVRLFLNEIYEQHNRTARMDARAKMATAPVVLENHFSLVPSPINSRRRCLPVSIVLGWLLGCVLAALVEQRKRIIAWLKQ